MGPLEVPSDQFCSANMRAKYPSHEHSVDFVVRKSLPPTSSSMILCSILLVRTLSALNHLSLCQMRKGTSFSNSNFKSLEPWNLYVFNIDGLFQEVG